MIYELKELVGNADGDEAKSLLFQMLLRISMVKEAKVSEKQFAEDMKRVYEDFLHYKSMQAREEASKDHQAVHIIFGDSPAGSLKMVLQEMGLQDREQVVSFSDMFSIGPIWRLHEEIGLAGRYEWLKDHINWEEEYLDKYQGQFSKRISTISAIRHDIPIIIWAGDNAHEQTALRFVLYLLREKANDVAVINATAHYKQLFRIPDRDCYPLHTGEITPEKLAMIYQKNRAAQPLSQEERKKYEEEWEELAAAQEVLRIWGEEGIHNVDAAYYDDYIIHTARDLHNSSDDAGFMKSARLIGQVIGCLNQYICDDYVEYRVRHLVMNGVFDIKGIPKAMRFYSVKLRDQA